MFKSNQYFDGKVVSIAFQGESLPATVGVMAPGDYEFGTRQAETMQVVSGAMAVLLPAEAQWRTVTAGQSFQVPADSRFQVRIEADCAYLCLYH